MKKQNKSFNKLTRESIESLSKEFVLSDKRHDPYGYGNYEYPEEDVKEFIQKEEILIKRLMSGIISVNEFWEERNRFAGESLI